MSIAELLDSANSYTSLAEVATSTGVSHDAPEASPIPLSIPFPGTISLASASLFVDC